MNDVLTRIKNSNNEWEEENLFRTEFRELYYRVKRCNCKKITIWKARKNVYLASQNNVPEKIRYPKPMYNLIKIICDKYHVSKRDFIKSFSFWYNPVLWLKNNDCISSTELEKKIRNVEEKMAYYRDKEGAFIHGSTEDCGSSVNLFNGYSCLLLKRGELMCKKCAELTMGIWYYLTPPSKPRHLLLINGEDIEKETDNE